MLKDSMNSFFKPFIFRIVNKVPKSISLIVLFPSRGYTKIG